MAVFDYVRISLSKPQQTDLLALANDVTPEGVSRGAWLSQAFGVRRDFFHKGKMYSFLPKGDVEGFATGFFGRDNSGIGRAGPDEDFHEKQLENWDLAFFCLDLAPDSQIALMQYNRRVGSTRAIIYAFLESLVRKTEFRDWEPHVEFLTREDDFWSAAERFKGQITRLKFTFVPPNALRAEERVMDLVREAKESTNADALTHIYENADGDIDPSGDIVRGSVNVASRGGGSAEIKVGKRTVFSDAQSKQIEELPAKEIPDPEKPITITGFIRNFFKK
jgi:hypothetical protein